MLIKTIRLACCFALASIANLAWGQEVPSIEASSIGNFAVFSAGDCQGPLVVDLDYARNGIVHFMAKHGRDLRSTDCVKEMAAAEFLAQEHFPEMSEIYYYSIGEWTGENIEGLSDGVVWQLYIWPVRRMADHMTQQTYIKAVANPNTSKSAEASIREYGDRVRSFRTFGPEEAKPYIEFGYTLPEPDDFPPYIREAGMSVVKFMAEVLDRSVKYQKALEARNAKARAKAEAATGPSCRWANIRLVECVNGVDMTAGGVTSLVCGGHQPGTFGSPASACSPIFGYWCDLETGNMYKSRALGAEAICR